jgi:hypothetical protein
VIGAPPPVGTVCKLKQQAARLAAGLLAADGQSPGCHNHPQAGQFGQVWEHPDHFGPGGGGGCLVESVNHDQPRPTVGVPQQRFDEFLGGGGAVGPCQVGYRADQV